MILGCIPAIFVIGLVGKEGGLCHCASCDAALVISCKAVLPLWGVGSLFVGLYGRRIHRRYGTVFLCIAALCACACVVAIAKLPDVNY